MIATVENPRTLFEQMPAVKGRLRDNVVLSNITWFRVGGPADIMFKPDDAEDLSSFLMNVSDDIPVFTLGVGSNLLVRDGGYRGVIIRLGRQFAKMALISGDRLRVGAGALDGNVARFAAEAELTGAEFLSGCSRTRVRKAKARGAPH